MTSFVKFCRSQNLISLHIYHIWKLKQPREHLTLYRLYGQIRSHSTFFRPSTRILHYQVPHQAFYCVQIHQELTKLQPFWLFSNILVFLFFSRASTFFEILTNVWPDIVSSVFMRFESSFLHYDRSLVGCFIPVVYFTKSAISEPKDEAKHRVEMDQNR